MDYSKQPLDIDQQITLLRNRGLAISDDEATRHTLGFISYFRLANYFRPMEADKELHTFKPASTFDNAVRLYEFDCALRELVFKTIGRIEIALRTMRVSGIVIIRLRRLSLKGWEMPGLAKWESRRTNCMRSCAASPICLT